jgi:hypothetical protein
MDSPSRLVRFLVFLLIIVATSSMMTILSLHFCKKMSIWRFLNPNWRITTQFFDVSKALKYFVIHILVLRRKTEGTNYYCFQQPDTAFNLHGELTSIPTKERIRFCCSKFAEFLTMSVWSGCLVTKGCKLVADFRKEEKSVLYVLTCSSFSTLFTVGLGLHLESKN